MKQGDAGIDPGANVKQSGPGYYVTGGAKDDRTNQLEADKPYVNATIPGMTHMAKPANLGTLQRISIEGRTAGLIRRFPAGGKKSGL